MVELKCQKTHFGSKLNLNNLGLILSSILTNKYVKNQCQEILTGFNRCAKKDQQQFKALSQMPMSQSQGSLR